MKYVQRADGAEAVADDMPPPVRAIALLLEHANGRRAAGLALPCPCGECDRHRGEVACTTSEDGLGLVIYGAGA
jgi:hypothetical protein